jgi:hypothetical protein
MDGLFWYADRGPLWKNRLRRAAECPNSGLNTARNSGTLASAITNRRAADGNDRHTPAANGRRGIRSAMAQFLTTFFILGITTFIDR